MRRGWRKGVAFLLAVAMMTECLHTTAWAAESPDGEDAENVYELTEVKYDEAVTFQDTIVLLENGNWAGGSASDKYLPDRQQSNVSLDTNLIFVDKNGNKKIISNNDNGETLFDAVYPMVSGSGPTTEFRGWDEMISGTNMDVTETMTETLKVIKDNKMSYIKSDGTYFADELKFYYLAQVLNDNLWLVSDDGNIFRIVTPKGDIVLDNLTQTGVVENEGIVYIATQERLYAFNANGQLVSSQNINCSGYFYPVTADSGYSIFLSCSESGETAYIYNSDGTFRESLEAYDFCLWKDYGECIVYRKTEDATTCTIYNLKKQSILYETDEYPDFSCGTFLGTINGVETIFNKEGCVYVESITDLLVEISNKVGFSGYATYECFLYQGVFFVNLVDINDSKNIKTVLLHKKDGFSVEKGIILDGYIDQYDFSSKEYFAVRNDNQSEYIDAIYNLDGEKVVELTDDYKYKYWGYMWQQSQQRWEEEKRNSEYVGEISVYDNSGKYMGRRLVAKNGHISELYSYFSEYNYGTFVSAQREDSTYVVFNKDAEIVYQGLADEIIVCDIYNHFIVEKDNKQYVYDSNGNIIYSSETDGIKVVYRWYYDSVSEFYNDIGGRYYAHEDDCFSGYRYTNCILKNRLCVVEKTENGITKYGVIKLGGTLNITNGLNQEKNGDWYYYVNGVWANNYTGLVEHYGAWFYVEEGVLNWNYTGLVQHYDAWFYVENGQLNWGYTGLVNYNAIWFYVQNGQLNWGYTGLVQHYDAWFYVENGMLNWNYTGLVNYNDIWFYVENGQLNWGYTGLVQHYGAWFYVEGGMLNWNYTGLVQYNGIWFYVENGQLNWGYTGLVQHYGAWFYVEGGMLNWNYTGLVQYYDAWFYVNGGQLDWSYTGLCEYNGVWFYIQGGQLNWGYTGTVYYNGIWWYVENGIVVRAA